MKVFNQFAYGLFLFAILLLAWPFIAAFLAAEVAYRGDPPWKVL